MKEIETEINTLNETYNHTIEEVQKQTDQEIAENEK